MADNADAAGISKGAIYHHFQSKDEIIQAITEKQGQALKSAVERWVSEPGFLDDKKAAIHFGKNIDSQTPYYLDEVMCVRMKSAQFIFSFMKDCVNKDSL